MGRKKGPQECACGNPAHRKDSTRAWICDRCIALMEIEASLIREALTGERVVKHFGKLRRFTHGVRSVGKQFEGF